MSDGPKLRRRLLPFEKNFTQIKNEWMRDERLSYRARGLLAMLFTHDDGFSVTLKAITSAGPQVLGEGLAGMRGAVNELEAHGYLRRHPISRGGRFVGDDWELCDPTGVHDATLFGLVDKSTSTASSERTRPRTASSERTRTASSERTPIRTLSRTDRAAPLGARPSSDSTIDDLWRTCPAPHSEGLHDFDAIAGWCLRCGQVRDDGSVRDHNGVSLRVGHGSTTSKEDGHEVAS